MMLHFIGFKGDEYTRAVQLFGKPDFIHRHWDMRARQEIVEGDMAVFARWSIDMQPRPIAFNDSEVM